MARTKRTKPTGNPATLVNNPPVVTPANQQAIAAATEQANKKEKYRQFFGLIDQIGGTAISAALYGALMSVLCYTGYQFFTSKLGGMLGQIFSDVFTGYAQLLLPQMLVPYASWIALSIPTVIFAYHATYAVLTGTHGLNNVLSKNHLQAALLTAAFVLPFAGFGLGVSLGMSMSGAYWLTGILGAASGVYMSELGQGIVQSFFPPVQEPADEPEEVAANDDVDEDHDLGPKSRSLLNDFGAKKKTAPRLADEAKARPRKKSAHEDEEVTPAKRRNRRT